ncbi:hypothetical protein ABH13_1928 [Bacillus velezensis]|uniref:Uncharacterized protein n=1 Tax=Bacillus amyloliquefaciens (strain Y2) TaxID=1155777 RepID=I2C6D0_BACAY|nr:hypothetical protein MUS_2258 [Bacillus velezensis YAU B9601-Y2]AGF27482.1 hypothetical protein KSO_009935 [Bacillus amyloliquefaciens IT-45]AGZ56645.1 hypothetical protein U471_19440 [Bacillus amyloliquefaciens CC178]AKL76512.1 hypothetical protein ABH13_1928 [Bacillus velezensis]EJD68849.1 hypothetical protein BB65665_04652 [Bacillus sp. 916]KYC89430.1 hypothetical protein B4140_2030 [Bacillus amyloliquefaciens]GFR56864.1 hypothetical protein MUS_2258 [Bacillus sp. CN2]
MTKTHIIIRPAAAKQPFFFFSTVFHPQFQEHYDFFIMTQMNARNQAETRI